MDRKLFFDLGGYDPEMRLYGGEEMEISFRIWQCGATLECVPCSRVGHVFRTGRYWQGQVYPVPGEVIVKNKLRAAEVWMDDYKSIVKRVMPPLPPSLPLGPLDHMQNIREKFQCKPFKWYLENVYPEMFIPNDKNFVRFEGEIRNPAKNACIDTLGATAPGSAIGAYPCHGSHGTQEFVFSQVGEVRVASMDYDTCVDAGGHADVRVWPCHGQRGNQEWKYDEKSGHIYIDSRCMTVADESTPRSPFSLKLVTCEDGNPKQEWRFKK
jgi:polypeptide N-acetylgalactosaminyltransferase